MKHETRFRFLKDWAGRKQGEVEASSDRALIDRWSKLGVWEPVAEEQSEPKPAATHRAMESPRLTRPRSKPKRGKA